LRRPRFRCADKLGLFWHLRAVTFSASRAILGCTASCLVPARSAAARAHRAVRKERRRAGEGRVVLWMHRRFQLQLASEPACAFRPSRAWPLCLLPSAFQCRCNMHASRLAHTRSTDGWWICTPTAPPASSIHWHPCRRYISVQLRGPYLWSPSGWTCENAVLEKC
jgi:hypothetical protein